VHYVESKQLFLVKSLEVVAVDDANNTTKCNLEQFFVQVSNLGLHHGNVLILNQTAQFLLLAQVLVNCVELHITWDLSSLRRAYSRLFKVLLQLCEHIICLLLCIAAQVWLVTQGHVVSNARK